MTQQQINKKSNFKMGKGQAFLQRRHIDGQQTSEKMLNITNYQANVNKNHSEISPHTSQDDYHQKDN